MKNILLLLLVMAIIPTICCMKPITVPVPLQGRTWFQQKSYQATHWALHPDQYCASALTAIKRNCGSCFEAWVNATPDIAEGEKNQLDELDTDGYTLIHRVILLNYSDGVRLLITKRASIETLVGKTNQQFSGYSPLRLARTLKKQECIDVLLENGAKDECPEKQRKQLEQMEQE